jgi:hypothetical protein
LRHDDLLSDALEVIVVPVRQFGLRHLDGALMVRRHHRDEIFVDVTRRLDLHRRHHLVHRRVVCREERSFGRACGEEGDRPGDGQSGIPRSDPSAHSGS